MVSQTQPDKLTPLQDRFVTYYCSVGSETRDNAYQSAIKAGYAATTANQACQLILGKIRVKRAISLYQEAIVETMDWNRTLNMQALARQIELLDGILKETPTNIQAIQARTAVIREANASSNQHSNTLFDGKDNSRTMTPLETEANRVGAQAALDYMMGHSVIDCPSEALTAAPVDDNDVIGE